ncbi:MAG: 3-deoxy-manno-octulosonate cytidylyltransferase [bacterium]|nr:3-deoxy-manno-octulosonate cytidylyltransferase [bacterium]
MNEGRVLVVIPARWASSRFPGKALADLGGEPLVVRVARNAARMSTADRVVVATDDERILAAVEAAGAEAVMTGAHETGTDRIGEVAVGDEADIVVNLQGDEPLLDPSVADDLVAALRADPAADLATCGHPFTDTASWQDPNFVKVVVGQDGGALYFSRAPIPGIFPGSGAEGHLAALRHVGIYAFRRRALQRFLTLERTPLERTEGLEQLRALEHGLRILVTTIEDAPVGVDTPEDLEAVRRLWTARG